MSNFRPLRTFDIGRGIDRSNFRTNAEFGAQLIEPQIGVHMTRRPPKRAPCLARHHQVTMRASFQRVGPGKPGSQLPVGDGWSPRGYL